MSLESKTLINLHWYIQSGKNSIRSVQWKSKTAILWIETSTDLDSVLSFNIEPIHIKSVLVVFKVSLFLN